MMLKALSLGTVGVLAVALATPACLARDQNNPPPPPMHGPAFADLDTNHDGVISKDEFAAPMMKHFGDIDTNGDGTISQDEFNAGMARRHDHMGPPPGEGHRWGRHHDMDLKSLDTNGDGKVSFDEFTAPMKNHFDRMDANHDGTLDQTELSTPHDDGDGPPPPPPPAGN